LISKREGKKAARQAAAEMKRGGGEIGSMERGESMVFASSTGEVTAADGAAATAVGNTKAIGVTSERSESWQQDMAQAITPAMSCSQSM
jgi:hypothetical protein